MKLWFKYDVAISVAEEDKRIAHQIVTELKKRKIRCYYYKEHPAESWGEHIINLTKDAFGNRSRFVLLITSKAYIKKYWSGIERQMAFTNPITGHPHILQLRLDDTQVDGISYYTVHHDWNNNPEEISEMLIKKIRKQQHITAHKIGKYCIGALILITAIALLYIDSMPGHRNREDHKSTRDIQKVLITDPPSSSSNNKAGLHPFFSKYPDSFYISNTEVTIAQYRKFCDEQKKNLPLQLPSSSENNPIVNVTWDEALAFCKWSQGRLPTEAEWEYAARASFFSKYSGGNNAHKVSVYGKLKPGQVATKAPNAFGLYDMTGNVAEWCNDWYDSSFTYKSVRGGSYNSKINPVNELAVTYRGKELPDTRSPYIGFRVVWDKK